MKNIKFKNRFIVLLFSALIGVGCSAQWLDVVEDGGTLTLEQIFRESNSVDTYLMTCYQGAFYTDGNIAFDPAMTGTDEYIIPEYYQLNPTTSDQFIVGPLVSTGQQTYYNPYGSKWGRESDRDGYLGSDGSINHTNRYVLIEHCNIFLRHVDLCRNKTQDQINEFKAYVRAIKAWYYFELVRQYGPITLVEDYIAPNEDLEVLQRPRSHVDTCFNTIVALLDKAIDSLPPRNKMSPNLYKCFNQDAALALKARVLTYQASPLFNGNPDYADFKDINGNPLFSTTVDATKWDRAAEAATDAIERITANGPKLEQGTQGMHPTSMNTQYDIMRSSIAPEFKGDEWLWVTVDKATPAQYKYPSFTFNDINGNTHPHRSVANVGTFSVTGNVVDLYYTENGLPIEMDPDWNFDARNTAEWFTDWNYNSRIVTYQDVLNAHVAREPRFYANIGFDRGYWLLRAKSTDNDIHYGILAREGEEIARPNPSYGIYNTTGYWCKKGLTFEGDGFAHVNIQQHYHPVLRLSELYLLAAEALNEAGRPDEAIDYLDVIRTRAGIPGVKEAWANSYNPAFIENVVGLREVIHQERAIELLFEGHRFWDLRRWKTASVVLNQPLKGWNIDGTSAYEYYNNFDGYKNITNRVRFQNPRDNFFPIDSDEVQKSNITQTLYW